MRQLAGELLADPKRVSAGLEATLRRERDAARGGPGLEEEAWLERLAEADRTRRRLQQMTARGLMTLDELAAALEEIELSRGTLLEELEGARVRRERIGALERDGDALLNSCLGAVPRTLECLGPEERNRVYRLLRLGVLVGPDGGLTVSGAPGTARLASF